MRNWTLADINALIPAEDLKHTYDVAYAAQSRPYYDQVQDIQKRNAYYQPLSRILDKDQLFDALHDLLTRTHKRKLSYRESRLKHLYPWIDLHENEDGQRDLQSIYSGKRFSSRDAIRADFEIEASRLLQFQAAMRASDVPLSEVEQEVLHNAIADENPFNCEHVVPQSWFAKAKPMRGDLHHLFACDPGCNSFRSNLPFFDFPPDKSPSRQDCGHRIVAERKFEPIGGKGAAARATLYFLLRYPGEIGDEDREMQQERLPLLLRWHKEYPVTRYEKHRNAGIFEAQGNRNPLIDFPVWASSINFRHGFS